MLPILFVATAAALPPPIIDGLPADDLPAVVALSAQLGDTPQDGWAFCSGTLVDPEWVLTAAHCVTNIEQRWDDYGIRAIHAVFGASVDDADATWVEMSSWTAHEGYAPAPDGSSYHDVAVVHLSRPVHLVEPLPAVGPEIADRADGSELFRVAGFGRSTDEGGDGDRLYADLAPVLLDDRFVWLKDPDGVQNVCYGDSGGPALLAGAQGGWSVAAISSQLVVYDASHACEGNGVIAARVDLEWDWIEGHVDLLTYDEWYDRYGTTDQVDTGETDTGDPPGDDTAPPDDTAPTHDDTAPPGDTAPTHDDTADDGETAGGCACGVTPGGGPAALAILALGLLATRRRRH